MKKIVFFLTFALALTLSACTEIDEPTIDNTTARALKILATKVSGCNTGRGELVTNIDWKDRVVKPIVPDRPPQIDTVAHERDTTGDGRRKWERDSIAFFNIVEAVIEVAEELDIATDTTYYADKDINFDNYYVGSPKDTTQKFFDAESFLADYATETYGYYYFEIEHNKPITIEEIAANEDLLVSEKILLAVRLGLVKGNGSYLTYIDSLHTKAPAAQSAAECQERWRLGMQRCYYEWKNTAISSWISGGVSTLGYFSSDPYTKTGCYLTGLAILAWNGCIRDWARTQCENIVDNNLIECNDYVDRLY